MKCMHPQIEEFWNIENSLKKVNPHLDTWLQRQEKKQIGQNINNMLNLAAGVLEIILFFMFFWMYKIFYN